MPAETAFLPDEAALEEFGERLAGRLAPGTVLVLTGPLGAGKTTLVRGLARGLGATAEATSPTYSLIHEYPTPAGPLVHADAYRLQDPRRLWALGLAELIEGARLTAVEWGLSLLGELDAPAVARLSPEGGGRRLELDLPG